MTVQGDILNDIADQIGGQIGGCSYCEGEDRGHFVHAFNNDPFDLSSRMELSPGMELSEYLSWQGVPEELNELMSELIQCPCGHGRVPAHSNNPNSGLFDLNDEVYTKRDVAEYWGFQYDVFSAFSRRYGETIEVEELNDFKTHLSLHPMLAKEHRLNTVILDTTPLNQTVS